MNPFFMSFSCKSDVLDERVSILLFGDGSEKIVGKSKTSFT